MEVQVAEGDFQDKPGPGGWRVVVDREACIGAADCVVAAPTVFALDHTRRVVLLDPYSVEERAIWRAAERCPTDDIILENARGDQLYP